MNLTEQIKSKVAEQKAMDDASIQAAATPLPGALADAFAPAQTIKVGPYEVRPFYDCDWEFLQWLEHPLKDILNESKKEIQNSKWDDFMPTGPHAWQLCWLMTRSTDEADELFAETGAEGVKEKARSEFRKIQLRQTVALINAISIQIKNYWSPVLNYEAVEGEKSSHPHPKN